MRLRRVLATIPAIVLATAACQVDQPADRTIAPPLEESIAERDATIPQAPAATAEQEATGELASVDLDAQTLTMMVDGSEQVFSFSDATTITGAAGTQGLAAREGSRVTVSYREEGLEGARTAVSIELLEQQP